jgi:hypothetical protein
MRSRSLILLAAALVPVSGAAASSGDMTLTVSSHAAGAPNVRITAVVRYEMQCAYPGVAPARLTWPGHVPSRVARGAVLVDGKPARLVSVHGHVVSVGMAPRSQVMCDVIGPGRLIIALTSRAGLANPAAGNRTVVLTKGAMRFSASLAFD